jgi:1,4-dihydroxy-2-naphthoyl-CoA hydrolase
MSLIDRINANPLPFAQWLGIEFMSAEADSVAARMLIRPELCTIGATAHGGAIMSFADTLGAAAAFINLPARRQGDDDGREQDQFHRRRACPLDRDRSRDPRHRGRRTQVWQTRVTTESEKLVALVVQTQMNL